MHRLLDATSTRQGGQHVSQKKNTRVEPAATAVGAKCYDYCCSMSTVRIVSPPSSSLSPLNQHKQQKLLKNGKTLLPSKEETITNVKHWFDAINHRVLDITQEQLGTSKASVPPGIHPRSFSPISEALRPGLRRLAPPNPLCHAGARRGNDSADSREDSNLP